jgi:cytoskeleton protein RodZ
MLSVGETLRAERLKRNLGLDQIASELKISSRFLEAIETEQFDKLPGGVFTKSFVRQYARLLGGPGAARSGAAVRRPALS